MRTITISTHCIERFRQRGRPLTFKQAERELMKLAENGEWHDRAPAWAMPVSDHDGCLVLGDLCLIVANNVAVTCIARGTISPKEREKRRTKKRERREALARRRGL